MKRRIDFICVGAQKAGTTTLHDVLKQHPDICLPKLKEAHFFDREERYSKGLKWWFDTFFSNCTGQRCVGVFTPEYLFYEEVAGRIVASLGDDIKILIIVRDPVERAYSHYRMSVARGYEDLPFELAIECETTRVSKDDFSRNHFSYVSRGLYTAQVARYIECFGQKNVLTLVFEDDIVRNLSDTLVKIQEFLSVEYVLLRPTSISNQGGAPRFKSVEAFFRRDGMVKKFAGRVIGSSTTKELMIQFLLRLNHRPMKSEPLPEKVRRRLYETHFDHDVRNLEDLISRDLSQWRRC